MNLIRCSIAALTVMLAITGCGTTAPPPALPRPAAADALRVLDSGPVEGFVNDRGGHSWLGIPYAAPPVGALRWHAPAPVTPWTATRPALAAGAPCIQYGWPGGGIGAAGTRQGNEDCLYLNVYGPRMTVAELAASRLPVMVWIHGGSNTVGHAAFYDGSTLANAGRVIVVMINYRLGPFGWFGVPGQREAGPATVEGSGNWGVLDALAALRWVQANAAAFGGDPHNVTVFGESAGGTNTLALMVSPLSSGLFHRAIVQSLGFGMTPLARATHYVDDPEPGDEYSSAEILLKLLVRQGRAADRATARVLADSMSPAAVGEFLRSLDPWTVYEAYGSTDVGYDRLPTVFQDGAVVRTGEVRTLLADPASHVEVPTIFGTNREEVKLFMALDPRHVRLLGGVPAWIRDPVAYERESRYRAQLWKADGVDSITAALVGGHAPTYAYRWDWREEGRHFGVVDVSQLLGAAHGLEVAFVLGHFDVGPQSGLLFSPDNALGRVALSDAMMSYWSEFAANGRPGRGRDGTLPEWQSWSSVSDAPKMMVLDTLAGGGIRMSAEQVSRDEVMAGIAAESIPTTARCRLFRATFRSKHDAWADAAWTRFDGGRCAAGGAGRLGP